MKRSPIKRSRVWARAAARERAIKRAQRRYALQFGDKAAWIRLLPCVGCGAPPPSDPHHVRSRGAGGTSRDLVPLCRACHGEGHGLMGWTEWEAAAGIDLAAEAQRLEQEWETQC